MSLPLWAECAWFVDECIEDVMVDIEISDESFVDDLQQFGQQIEGEIDAFSYSLPKHVETKHNEQNEDVNGAEVGQPFENVESNDATLSDFLEPNEQIEPTIIENIDESEQFEPTISDCVEDVIIIDPLAAPEPKIEYVFQIKPSINRRIYLYFGDIYKIPCDAIVVGQVESLTDRHDGNDAIFNLAGPEMELELADNAPVTTGGSVATGAGLLPCTWVIHAVGPKYDQRYITASDHALFSAYKSSLVLAASKNVKDLIIGCIHKHSKRYPRFEAAHVALRTVRKFLEHSVGDGFERLMLCVPTQEDYEIYSALMHAYFPRTQAELEGQLNLLPPVDKLGDEWGELVIADRVLKVSLGPQPLPSDSMMQYKAAAAASLDSNDEATEESKGGSSNTRASNSNKKLLLGKYSIRCCCWTRLFYFLY